MDSKILTELNDLKDKLNNIKLILSEDITSISKQISDKIELFTYKYTDEEWGVIQEIEELIKYINNDISDFYKYEEDNEIKGE